MTGARIQADQWLHGEIVTNMAQGVMLVRTTDREIVYTNRKFAEMFGYDEGELTGRPAEVLTAPSELDQVEDATGIQRAVSRDGSWSGEMSNVRKDGTRFWTWAAVSSYEHPEHGEVSVTVQSDITERKRIEMELERSNEELGQFASVASHDLREPLRVIAGFVQLLQRRYKGQLDEQADTFIAATVDGVERMQAMIDALLEYSRVGRSEAERQPMDCDAAVAQARLDLDQLISERHAEVEVGSLPTVLGDAALIQDVFQNLISNAVKYGDPERPRVEVSAERTNGDWCFTVADNGGGVDPADSESVFEMFKRLHTRDQAGTGIGLAICKRIVEKHGGRIWVEPRDGGGSAFRFTVPA